MALLSGNVMQMNLDHKLYKLYMKVIIMNLHFLGTDMYHSPNIHVSCPNSSVCQFIICTIGPCMSSLQFFSNLHVYHTYIYIYCYSTKFCIIIDINGLVIFLVRYHLSTNVIYRATIN